MGAGLSTELGEKSLVAENRAELEAIKQRVASNDKTLTNLDLANRAIGDQALIKNVGVIAANTGITRLDLSFNELTEASIASLVSAVKQMPQLKVLDLAGNNIGEVGCRLLGEYLATNPPLEQLYVFHNNLFDKAIVPFANALVQNDNLILLNMDQNNFTNASWVMLHKALCVGARDENGNPLFANNQTLAGLKVGTRPDIVPSDAIIEDVMSQLATNRARYEERRAKEVAAAQRQAELEARQRVASAEADRAAADEAHRQAEEAYAAEEQRRAEEEEMRMYEEQAAQQQRKSKKKSKEELQAENERWVRRAMDQAYGWRNKLTQNGSLVKEWKDGFTTLTTRPGDELGSKPTATLAPERRLRACWCDPNDVSVPYAKTLHYHCKYEDLNKPLQDGQVPRYDGCYATGHVCASVGHNGCKARPDKSAAHFFSSPPRAAREDGNDVFEDGNMTNVSTYTRSQNATSNGTAAPAALHYY